MSITDKGALEWTYVFFPKVWCDVLFDRLLRNGRTSEEVGRDRKAAVKAERALSVTVSARLCWERASRRARGMSSLKGLYSSVFSYQPYSICLSSSNGRRHDGVTKEGGRWGRKGRATYP